MQAGDESTKKVTKCLHEQTKAMMIKKYGDKASIVEVPSTENITLQEVTQDLVKVIKNLQKQLHDVNKNDLPTVEPENKEFFKSFKSTPDSGISDKNKSPSSATKKKNIIKNNNPKQASNTRCLIPKFSTVSSSIKKTHCSAPNNKFTSPTTSSLGSNHSTPRSSSSRYFTQKSSTTLMNDPLKLLTDEVQKAMREHKVFTIRGNYSAVRKALLERGWVEKYDSMYKQQLNEELKRYQSYSIHDLLPLLRVKDLTNTCKNLIKSKLLSGYQVDFYWGTSVDAFKENPDKIKHTLINRMKRDIFSYTNKQGLSDAARISHWYQQDNVSKLNHPRSYSISKTSEATSFTEDFNITAAMSLLKWVVKNRVTRECRIISQSGKIPLEVFHFAFNECCKFFKKLKHEDIDMDIQEASEQEWKQFLEFFYKIVHYSNHFGAEKKVTEDDLYKKSNYILNALKDLWPYLHMDGLMNIWILKPVASSQGKGIHICRTLQYIMKTKNQNSSVRYIIQKYIERPLLIYNTKFDIRQWFLISCSQPLTIWTFKECYLRFSSQTYNLRKLHESIHLTNNSVQSKYKTTSMDAALPSYNMWDSNEFQTYLSNIGFPNAFKKVIYPGMKQCITAAVLMHQDKMIVRKNSFELYGADFMLTEDFQPWLLEINSNPALFASTPVTSRMCPRVLTDVIKVVIDYAKNTKASTGSFELSYQENVIKLPPPGPLKLNGYPLKSDYFYTPEDDPTRDMQEQEKEDNLKNFGNDIKSTLKNLLGIIHSEKNRRHMRLKSVGCGSFFHLPQNKEVNI